MMTSLISLLRTTQEAFRTIASLLGRYSTSYRPERHYMRGPGPAFEKKHGSRNNM